MIGFVEGEIAARDEDLGLLCLRTTGGVGYELAVPRSFFERSAVGETTRVWVHTHVREDALVLFGFQEEREKRLFRILLGVSGLGPKTALSLLSHYGADAVVRHIVAKDAKALSEAQGVGAKLAQKIVLDLATKLEKLAWVERLASQSFPQAARPAAEAPPGGLRDDLHSALTNLGYGASQVKAVLEKLPLDEGDQPFESLFRLALQRLTNRTVGSALERSGHG
jgi:Holliday junction DNA helicase RuvA